MKLTIVTIVFVLMNLISEAHGCTCAVGTDQEVFCRAEFASRGKITEIKPLKGGQVEYTVAVNYNFKIKVPKTLKVRSEKDVGAECGVKLDKGVEYLISGTVTKNRYGSIYRINSCLWNQKWQSIKFETQRKLLRGQFNNC
ncbi:NTR domain-containing protein-like [Mytilus edulis]|uniref:NTR domain-containing protein-like n=1 Tax=Mytilus edulis TaxID=6550 RepID=UPI0039F021E2